MFSKMSVTYLGLIMITLIMHGNASYQRIAAENLTHITADYFLDPAILKMRNQLIYVSFVKVNSNLTIKLETYAASSTDNYSANKTCEITFEVPQNRDFSASKVKTLGNEKIVISLVEINSPIEEVNKPRIRFNIVNFYEDCSWNNFSIPIDESILWSYEKLWLIPYQDTFDVIVKSSLHCKPTGSICAIRFTDKGEPQGTFGFDFPTSESIFDLQKIYPTKKFESSEGYVHISKNDSSLRKLDPSFKVSKEIRVNGVIVSESVVNGEVGVCSHVDESERHIECLKFDSRLKLKFNVSLSEADYYKKWSLHNLDDGSSLIVQVTKGINRTFLDARRLRVDGTISDSVQYFYSCSGEYSRGFADDLIELKGGNYCFVIECMANVITHCLPLSDAKKLGE